MSTPKPKNFDELTRTWNDPEAFAAECLRYYADLESTGHRAPTWDRPAHGADGAAE